MRTRRHPSSTNVEGELDGRAVELAVARNLARIYAEVLRDPPPSDLRWLIRRLERQLALKGPTARPLE